MKSIKPTLKSPAQLHDELDEVVSDPFAAIAHAKLTLERGFREYLQGDGEETIRIEFTRTLYDDAQAAARFIEASDEWTIGCSAWNADGGHTHAINVSPKNVRRQIVETRMVAR